MVSYTHLNNIDRALERRSYLKFNYPKKTSDTQPSKIILLPFYQNPKIRESKRARYVKYGPLSRSSELFTYVGAEARNIDLNFSMTIDHLVNYYMNWETFVLESGTTPEQEKAKFFTAQLPTGTKTASTSSKELWAGSTPTGQRGNSAELTKEYMERVDMDFADISELADTPINPDLYDPVLGNPISLGVALDSQHNAQTTINSITSKKQGKRAQVIDIMTFWANVVRTSVTNHSQNTVLGPPIIRLNHGILYRDVPFVCMDYRIEEDERAGMDINTLLPRVLKISMKLQEIRAGNFQGYKVSEIDSRDCVAGWEAVISEPHTTDPQPLGGV